MPLARRTRLLTLLGCSLAGVILLAARIPLQAQGTDSLNRDTIKKLSLLVRKLQTFADTVKPRITVPEGHLRDLLVDRFDTSLRKLRAELGEYEKERIDFNELDRTFGQLRDSAEALSDKPADQIEFLELDLELARTIESHLVVDAKAGRCSRSDAEEARYHRLDAEIRLLKAKMLADKK
jgi:MoxR-like ATPase